jgi:hypothetical protein
VNKNNATFRIKRLFEEEAEYGFVYVFFSAREKIEFWYTKEISKSVSKNELFL